MRLFDTHAHLHFPDYGDDLEAVLDRAHAAGVCGMVTIGTDRETNRAVVAMARRLPDVWATGPSRADASTLGSSSHWPAP